MYGHIAGGTAGTGASLAMTGFGAISWIVAAASLTMLGIGLLRAGRRVPSED